MRSISDGSAGFQRAVNQHVDRLCAMVTGVAVAIKKGVEER